MTRVRGFTLVEVMVALAVFSLVMLATVSGYRTLGNTASTIDRMTDRTDEIRSVSAFLRDALENSVVGTHATPSAGITFGGGGGQANDKMFAFFKADESSVEWRSKILFGEAYGGSYFLRLARVEDQLLLKWQEASGRNIPDSWVDAPSRPILKNLQAFEVWTRLNAGDDWVNTPIEGESPGHVKLVVKADDRFWPDLIMVVQR